MFPHTLYVNLADTYRRFISMMVTQVLVDTNKDLTLGSFFFFGKVDSLGSSSGVLRINTSACSNLSLACCLCEIMQV